MAEGGEDWKGLSLCCAVAAILFMDKPMHKLLRFARSLLDVSPLRKAFTGLSLLAITYFLGAAIAEQATDVLNPQGPILWFMTAAITAMLLFWVWEEILEVSPTNRVVFITVAGVLVVFALRHEVKWVTAAADDAATRNEIQEARDCKNKVDALRDHAMTLKLYSALITHSDEPPEVANRKSETLNPKSHKETQSTSTEIPVQLTAQFYNPQSPDIVVSDPSDHVVEKIRWGAILFRTSDLSYFSFATQAIDYVKPHAVSGSYQMFPPGIQRVSDGSGQLADGDELTGSVFIDCPQCKVQTYIIHLVWGHSGWFYESQQKAGYIVPKDMSKNGRAKYIQLLTSDVFAKDRIEIVSKPPL